MEISPNFSRRELFSIGILTVAILWYFIENTLFGWNREPQSSAESAADFMVFALVVLSFLWRPSKVEITNHHTQYKMTFARRSKKRILKPISSRS